MVLMICVLGEAGDLYDNWNKFSSSQFRVTVLRYFFDDVIFQIYFNNVLNKLAGQYKEQKYNI